MYSFLKLKLALSLASKEEKQGQVASTVAGSIFLGKSL